NLTASLRATYPVICRLVGDSFFDYVAAQYITAYPSRSGDLEEFGGDFARFLEIFTPAAELVYLPDVARLEWIYRQIFYAADHPPLDLSALAQVPAEQQGDLHFQLHPAARLLQSAFPILRIWQVNQADYAGDAAVDLTAGGIRLLALRRDHFEIEFQPLSVGELILLLALEQGFTFAAACEQAMTAQPDMDLSACFSRHVLQGALVRLY
ncbi:MAG: DUF2063 domain-containing protein, partial [Synechococcaceae cyanobacterium SM1_2_3]|nr:DUF2063 domain-containing protein [Synechococcaceae cyanobacterium SM1_2_3]